MTWLAAAIFAIAVIYFAIHHAGFRKILLITLAGIVVLGIAGGAWLYWDQQRTAARTAYAKTLIKFSDIEFYGLTLSSDYGHTVRGTVRNRSSYPLKSFRMKITVQDCPEGKCVTIGEDELWEYGLDVPPGQVRAFNGYASFPGMPIPVAQQWYYSVTELEAKLD